VVLVEAQLPSIQFEGDDGKMFTYAHGMFGKGESPVREEPVIYAFVPTLREWAERVRPLQWLGRLFGSSARAATLATGDTSIADTSRK
jgi:hypothetical protein